MNAWLERHRILILGSIGLLLVLTGGLFAIRWQPPAPIVIEPPAPTPTPGPIQVYISGAVLNPDVYEVAPDTITQDVIEIAGGAAADADLNLINLAQPLSDGDQIYVPVVGEAPPPAFSDAPSGVEQGGIVNINSADQAALETLPGIGPALAERILEYRDANGPFPDVDALQNVSGIGPATLDEIRDQITVE